MEKLKQLYENIMARKGTARPTPASPPPHVKIGILAFMLAAVVTVMIPESAWAFTTPAVGSFAYEVYDIGVNMILKGPIGFVAGMLLIVYGGLQVLKSWLIGIGAILIGGLIVKADAVVVSLGAIVA